MADPVTTAAERRRALVAALWLAGAVLLGGLDLPARGYDAFRFAPFGIVSGLLGFLWVFALTVVGVIRRSRGWVGAVELAYWVAGTAMILRVLLPPPGLLQVGLAVAAALAAGIAATRDDREGAVVWTGVVAVALAVLKFAVVPIFEGRSGLPGWGPFDFAGWSDAFRDLFVVYAPQRPAVQALHFAALACWVLALWTRWDDENGGGVGTADRPPPDVRRGAGPSG